MLGSGVYFTSHSPADAMADEHWPSPKWRDALLEANYGKVEAKKPDRKQLADAVIICKVSNEVVKDVPERPGAKFVTADLRLVIKVFRAIQLYE